MGYGLTAVTGTIAGQMFNFLVGFGLNIIIGCIKHGKIAFDIFGSSNTSDTDHNNNIYSNVILWYTILHLCSLVFIPMITRY